jgi:Ser/Thr protein kinase RdoA (MazF antagonist)
MNSASGEPNATLRRWVHSHLGTAAAVDFSLLPGATSSTVFRVTVAGKSRAVLRLFSNAAWLQREADLAEHEAAALQHAARAGVPAPRLIAAAGAAELGTPAVLMTHLPGNVDLRPQRRDAWLTALAGALARIHSTGCDAFGWHYSSWAEAPTGTAPAWFGDVALWQRMRQVWVQGAPRHTMQFLHRDFHPVNVLWRGGALCGVVDWVNACCGPAAVDVAHCRVNLALMYGQRRADEFLHCYRRTVGTYHYDPFWDIDEVLGWSVDRPTYYRPWHHFGLRYIGPHELQDRLRRFVGRAVAQYG